MSDNSKTILYACPTLEKMIKKSTRCSAKAILFKKHRCPHITYNTLLFGSRLMSKITEEIGRECIVLLVEQETEFMPHSLPKFDLL